MAASLEHDQLLQCAIDAAKAAETHALGNVHRRSETIMVARHDVKLALDRECQIIAEDLIRSRFPTHEILGEEDTGAEETRLCQGSAGPSCRPERNKTASGTPGDAGTSKPGNGYLWVIDPIDGTVNFTHGMKRWCTSIAVQHNGVAVAGVVHAPELGETYTATATGSAELNGEAICVSGVASVEKAMIMTGQDKGLTPDDEPLAILKRIALNAQKVRVMGCAAVDLCQVACGRADAYFERGIYLWDIAAAGLIVERAGGTIEVLRDFGGHRMEFVATNGRIHAELRKLVSR